MKKIYSYLMALIALVTCSLTASAVNVTFKVDHPENVSVTIDQMVGDQYVQDAPVELTGTETVFECNQYATVKIKPIEGFLILSCKMDGIERSLQYNSGLNIYGDCEIEVTTAKLDDVQTGSFKLKIDDPTNMKITLEKSGELTNLQPGENTVKFIPELDKTLTISGSKYGIAFYRVTKNGEPITDNYNTYQIIPEEGMEVEVLANFPDEEELVTFSYNEGGEGSIKRVYVNRYQADEKQIEDFNNGFKVKCGQKVTIEANTEEFSIKSVMLNGNPIQIYSSAEFMVREATTVAIVAEKYGMIKAHVVLDDASRVIVYRGYASNNDIVEVVDGDNEIEVNSKNPTITIACTNTSMITSVKSGEEDLEPDYQGNYFITLTDGMVINVTTAIAKTKKFIAYYSKPSGLIRTSKYGQVYVNEGYNEIELKEDDYPVIILPPYDYSGNSEFKDAFFYIDDVLQNEEPVGSFTFTPDHDNSVVKVYSAAWEETPETTLKPNLRTLTFEYDSQYDYEFTVKKDKVILIENSKELKALDGTLIEIIPTVAETTREAETPSFVTVNDKDLTPDENGVYSFIVDSDAKVTINRNAPSGVSEVESVDGAVHPVYNLQGIKVLDSAEGINSLPSGVYIVNGKKVMK